MAKKSKTILKPPPSGTHITMITLGAENITVCWDYKNGMRISDDDTEILIGGIEAAQQLIEAIQRIVDDNENIA